MNGGEEECIYIIGGKDRGKEPLRRPRRRWVYNIWKHLGEVGWGDVNWIGLQKMLGNYRCPNKMVATQYISVL
jgi:hypothetical protein